MNLSDIKIFSPIYDVLLDSHVISIFQYIVKDVYEWHIMGRNYHRVMILEDIYICTNCNEYWCNCTCGIDLESDMIISKNLKIEKNINARVSLEQKLNKLRDIKIKKPLSMSNNIAIKWSNIVRPSKIEILETIIADTDVKIYPCDSIDPIHFHKVIIDKNCVKPFNQSVYHSIFPKHIIIAFRNYLYGDLVNYCNDDIDNLRELCNVFGCHKFKIAYSF